MADEIPPPPPGFVFVQPPAGFQAVPALPDERMIDQRTGAPWQVRAAVGAAQRPGDRLATIRKFFPDAQPYGDGNFVYTDPKTKRPTLYNDKGWMPSAGDLASILPEVGEFVGGTMGGVAATPPAVAGAPPTAGLSFAAIPLGVGLGAAAGRELVGQWATRGMGTVDNRSIGERLADTGMTTGVNAVAGRVGELAVEGVKRAAGPVTRALGGSTGSQILQDFAEQGVRATPGAVTGNRGVQMVEKGLSYTPGGARVMQDIARGQADRIAQNVDEMVGTIRPGGAGTVQQTGEAIRRAAGEAAERFTGRQGQLYDDAFRLVGDATVVQPRAVQALRMQLQSELQRAPASQQVALGNAIRTLDNLLADSQTGIPFNAWRQIRTNIGRDIDQPLLAGSTGAQNDALRRVYAALSDDMTATARGAGPEAERALALADRYTRRQMTQNMPVMQKIADLGADEKAWAFAMQGADKGASRLLELRRNFTPDEWGTVAATALDRMGRAAPHARGAAEMGGDAADFSVSTFLTNWEKLSPEARRVLFTGRHMGEVRESLDQLVRVAGRIKDVERLANPSGTARNLGVVGAASGAGGAALSGDFGTALGIIGSSTVAPYVTARMMTSPSFVRWLAGAEAMGSLSGRTIPAMAARLGAVAEANPEIREDVLRFQQQLQSVIPAGMRQPPVSAGTGR